VRRRLAALQGSVGEYAPRGLVGQDEQANDLALWIAQARIRKGEPGISLPTVGVQLPGQVLEALAAAGEGLVDDRLGLSSGPC